jgi:hypothetical protein
MSVWQGRQASRGNIVAQTEIAPVELGNHVTLLLNWMLLSVDKHEERKTNHGDADPSWQHRFLQDVGQLRSASMGT